MITILKIAKKTIFENLVNTGVFFSYVDLLVVNAKYHSGAEDFLVLKAVRGEIVQLLVPRTSAGHVNALTFLLTYDYRTDDLVSVKIHGLDSFLYLIAKRAGHVSAEFWIVGKPLESALQDCFNALTDLVE